MAKLVGHLVRVGSDEHLAIVGHPATDHSVDESVAHGGLECIARRQGVKSDRDKATERARKAQVVIKGGVYFFFGPNGTADTL